LSRWRSCLWGPPGSPARAIAGSPDASRKARPDLCPRFLRPPERRPVPAPPPAKLNRAGDARRRAIVSGNRSPDGSLSASARERLSRGPRLSPPLSAPSPFLPQVHCEGPPKDRSFPHPPPCSSGTSRSSANRPGRRAAAASSGAGGRRPSRQAICFSVVPMFRARTGMRMAFAGGYHQAEPEEGRT